MQIFRYVILENVLRCDFSSLSTVSTNYGDWYQSFKNMLYLMFKLTEALECVPPEALTSDIQNKKFDELNESN